MVFKVTLVFLLLFASIQTNAQKRLFSANARLAVKNYSPKDMGGNAQVFAIAQDSRGIMYFANQAGVLEFDGSEWRKITIENRKEVNYIISSPDGVIYIGGHNAYGQLVPDKNGRLKYQSLKSEFPDSVQNSFGLVKRILFKGDTKIIQTDNRLYFLSKDSTHIVQADAEINSFFLLESTLYIVQKDLGLYRIENSELVPVKDGHQFAVSSNDIVVFTKFKDRYIIVTSNGQLYEVNEFDEIVKLDIKSDASLFSATNIHDRYLSLGTISDGVRVLDTNFNMVYSIGLDNGLGDPQIKTQFYDDEGNLWLATNKGVSKVELGTPILFYDKESGIKTTVQTLEKHNNTIYAAALDGVYYFKEDGSISTVPGINSFCYGLSSLNMRGKQELYVAELDNVLKVDADTNISVVGSGGPYDIQISPKNPDELIVLHYDGLANYILNDEGEYELGRYVKDFDVSGDLFNFIIREDGTILIGTVHPDGIFVTNVDIFKDSSVPIINWTPEKNGLPPAATYLCDIGDKLFVATDSGLYYQDGDQFKKSNHFGIDFNKVHRGVHRISVDPSGRVWMILFDEKNHYEFGYSTLIDGKWVWNSREFMRRTDEIMHSIYHDTDQITWLGGPDGIIRFDGKIKRETQSKFHTIIRKVEYGSDEIYGGITTDFNKNKKYKLDYSDHNSLTFAFSATSFIDEEMNEFSYILEGYDLTWSDWSKRTVKEYNLSEGTYTFKVKSKNIYGIESDIAEFTFTILPPWYRTTWAYIAYLILFVVIVYLSILFSIRRVKKQNQRLEQTVKERTAEVVAQKEEVEKQKEIVEEKNRDIMDSIRYAKHIQDAILPSDEFVSECFKDAFIIYRPKDIVSGDFYWVKKKENKTLFAAVDCTGHGVPGAFVSIVGNNGLNRAINEFNLIRPGEILDKLTELVLESFKQPGSSDDEVKDGMDIALCVLDQETNTLEFSGANNSLYLVRDGEMIEYKPDKQPIGAFENRKPFTTHTIPVKTGDRIFVFTDGFADQFGGPKGKKLKYKAFKSMLIENNDRPISEYKMILNHAFNQWRGAFEQIDDVCVIGITI